MKCKQIRSLIYDYEDGAVDEITCSAIESHLSGCAACRLHYETKRTLSQSVAAAAADELAGLHFKPVPIKEEPSCDRRPFLSAWTRRMALAAACIIVLCAATWVLWKPVPKPADDQALSAYAEAYHYLDSPGTSGFATPMAVIIQPGVPARIIELNGTTDVSDALK